MDQVELNTIRLGFFLAEAVNRHELAWTFNRSVFAEEFKISLSEIRKIISSLNIPECSAVLNKINSCWDAAFDSEKHRSWAAINKALHGLTPECPVSPYHVFPKTLLAACFPGKPYHLLEKDEGLLRDAVEKEIAEEKSVSIKQIIELTARKTVELFYNEEPEESQDRITHSLYRILYRLLSILYLDNEGSEYTTEVFRLHRPVKELIIMKSPVWDSLSQFLPFMANKVEKTRQGYSFAFGFHAGLLCTRPLYLPLGVFEHALLIPSRNADMAEDLSPVNFSPVAAGEIGLLIEDEAARVGFHGEVMNAMLERLSSIGPENTRWKRPGRNPVLEKIFLSLLEREYAMRPAPTTNTDEDKIDRETDELPALLDVKSVSKMLGASKSTIYNWKDTGLLPDPTQIGGTVKWRRDEILDWIANGCPPQTRWKWKPK